MHAAGSVYSHVMLSVYRRQMSWNTPLNGWWMDWLTHGRLQDLDSALLWGR